LRNTAITTLLFRVAFRLENLMILTRTAAITCLIAIASPGLARTADQQASVDRYWALTEACRAGDRDAGQCEKAKAIQAQLKSEGLCFVWGEGDGFLPCETVQAAPEAVDVGFRGSVFRPVFQSLMQEDRKTVQRALQKAELYDGSIDGIYGPGTARAVRTLAEKIEATGEVDLDMRTPSGVREAIGRIMTFEAAAKKD
jgi:hypothetical protein